MKTGRRTDSDSLRRDARDVSRFNRKRPSMLSEFHGKHHGYRDQDRDSSDPPHFRSYRYSHDGSPGVPLDHGNRFSFSGGPYSKFKPDPRGKRMYSPLASHQSNYRAPHHHGLYGRTDSSTLSTDGSIEEDTPAKRPCLSVDMSQRACDPPNSADSAASSVHQPGTNHVAENSPPSNKGGLSAYHLEDIDSDDDDCLLKEEPPKTTASKEEQAESKEVAKTTKEPCKPSKEELLLMMERVDRDISALESQIATLQKKQAELEEGGLVTPATPSPKTPSPDVSSQMEQSPSEQAGTSSTEDRQPVSKMSRVETIYSENHSKARSAHGLLQALSTQPMVMQESSLPLYFHPSEAPCYHTNIISHRLFRPRLVEYLRRHKLTKHQRELSLCQRYDSLMADWERRVDKIETSSKKKTRDLKNRELFEKTFPELKARREQQERFTRVDQRGFGVVRSDAELNELMYELSTKEEAPARYRKTHAVIPPMMLEDRESRFNSSNGHVEDVMALHRELKFTNIWTEEEKSLFREKFVLYPKNFEMISKALPNKSPADCVKFYYLTKKSENFKQLVRKANLKRKKALIKPPELSLSTSSLPITPLSGHTPSLLAAKTETHLTTDEGKTKSEHGDWSEDNIACLKEGLRKFGRAWGKVYREVGGSKTATQCKMFYDDFCSDESLGLQEALLEHSRMKNAEKQRRRSQSRKLPPTETKKKPPRKPSPVRVSDGDSENTESASESDSNPDASESESTITDSGPDDVITDSVKAPPSQSKTSRSRGGSRKSNQSISSPPMSAKTSEDVVDLFLTAAEALKNNISPEVALQDHTYALPPSQLVNNMDLQGSSGLSLIAAAAAVVSPNLSRNAGSGKPVVSPVRAPRGRPPNKYRGGGSSSTVKLSPNFLSPAGGSSANVLLSDLKTATFRNRTRSAPTDRPKSSTIHIPRTSSTLARMSLSNSGGRSKSVMPVYTKQKSDSPSLKSMIALQPAQGATSAFEALVNVAVAAPPAELPKTSASSTGAVLTARNTKKSSANSRSSFSTPSPVNTLSSKLTLSRTNSNDSNNSLNSGTGTATATAYIDVSQAINILASLAQQTSGSSVGTTHTISVFPAQPLFAQAGVPSTIIGSIVSQGTSKQSTANISATSNPASVSATVDTLLSHLTSGVSKANPRNTPSPKPASRAKKAPKTESVKVPTTQPSETVQTSGDDLSNLKLLSSLVAAVAGTQASPSISTASVDTSTHSTASHLNTITKTESSSTEAANTWEPSHTSASTPNTEQYTHNEQPPVDHSSTNVDSLSSDDLPRGVVRPSLSVYTPSRTTHDHTPPPVSLSNSIHTTPTCTVPTTDMTASLASIIPSYNPSVGQQSTLLLYTRSRSFPQSVSTESVTEEEDHLESATRGISELSKLLGTDGNGDPTSPIIAKKGHDIASSFLNSTDSLAPATNGAPMSSLTKVILNDYSTPVVSDSATIKLNLSSLLESQGTVHTSTPASPSNHGNNITGDTPLNVDSQSR